MAAGFLHDIGHGPFSHAVDFPLNKLTSKTHEEISTRIISEELKELEHHGISIESVNRIVSAQHWFPFVSSIVNGPLDVDKLDYLLRDSHHVGLKYALDIENFIEGYTVLGDDKDLSKSELGLENTPEAITSAEIFLTYGRECTTLCITSRTQELPRRCLRGPYWLVALMTTICEARLKTQRKQLSCMMRSS